MRKKTGDETGRARSRSAGARPQWRRAAATAAFALVAGASAAPGRAAPTPAEVQIQEFRFAPARLEVRAGTTVEWVNRDEEPHTVTFVDGQAASAALDTDASFSRRFDAPGTYTYRCAIHPHMAGTIVVR